MYMYGTESASNNFPPYMSQQPESNTNKVRQFTLHVTLQVQVWFVWAVQSFLFFGQ